MAHVVGALAVQRMPTAEEMIFAKQTHREEASHSNVIFAKQTHR